MIRHETISTLKSLYTKRDKIKSTIHDLNFELSEVQRIGGNSQRLIKTVSFYTDEGKNKNIDINAMSFINFLQTQLQQVEAEIKQLNQKALEEINAESPID